MSKVVKGIIGKSGVYGLKQGEDLGVVYVGSGSSLESRYSNHKSLLRNNKHGNKLLQEVFNENGKLKEFEFVVLEYCDVKDLYKRELFYMQMYKSNGLCNQHRILDLEKLIRTGKEAIEHKSRWKSMMSGINNPNVKLSEKQIKEILWLKNNTSLTYKEIAPYFNIDNANYISRIGKDRWNHIKVEMKPSWCIENKKIS